MSLPPANETSPDDPENFLPVVPGQPNIARWVPPPLQVVLEDGPLLAVSKPAGLLTQSVAGTAPSLENQVKDYLRQKYQKPGNVYLGVPHRLDRPVSGLVLFAKNSKAAARLAEQFRERTVRKFYRAVLENRPLEGQGTLTDWLLKDASQAHVSVVPERTAGARECHLYYEVVESLPGNRVVVEVELLTGRMHQIRVQFATRGCPVVGDVAYGANSKIPLSEANCDVDAPIALHACRLQLKHPIRYDDLVVTVPDPAHWQAIREG